MVMKNKKHLNKTMTKIISILDKNGSTYSLYDKETKMWKTYNKK